MRPDKKKFGADRSSTSGKDGAGKGKFDPKKKFGRDSKPFDKSKGRSFKSKEVKAPSGDDLVRLNKYISNSGVCSRREADELIANGEITVNGEVVKVLGTKVKRSDKVAYNGTLLRGEQNVYILVNKPKDYITTLKDPQGRRTILELIRGACDERVYPVGRLDRNTTGLLLMTNDGELAAKLTHPSNNVRKVYHVELDRNVKPEDLQMLIDGIELEDGLAKADSAAYPDPSEKNIVGVELHSGKNRVVRRMFDALGYTVKKLDRVMFADLTKREVPRGKWRMLTDKEISYLKML